MDEEYERNVGKVMAYLSEKGRSAETVRRHAECYLGLGAYLRQAALPYSDEAAWEWFEGVSGGLGATPCSIYVGALGKIGDLYATGEIKSHHYRGAKKEDGLGAENAEIVGFYCAHLRESGLAAATVANHRSAAVRLMLDLQGRGVRFVADAGYADLIGVLLECESMTYYAKTGYRGMVRSLLAYLHSEGLVPYGFTLLVDAMALKKGYCWNGVEPERVAELRRGQSADGDAVRLDTYLAAVEGLAREHQSLGYARNVVCSVAHFGGLLYLFMDANGLLYDPTVAMAWLESMRPALSYSDFASCRRIVLLLQQGFDGVARDLSRSFSFRETLRDRLPQWCEPQVDAFLATKSAEGWRRSTLDMFQTCTCRFCIFADGIGVTSFADLTAEHVKLFNAADAHATPEGKNAFNSRVRQFLEWLGCKGMLANPNLCLALPNVAAPRETQVVTLTPSEQDDLRGALGEIGGITLRDKAMLQMGLRMGIRASDVVGLSVRDIDWDGPSVRFVQAKTGYEVDLPMPADVANAIFRYVTLERQTSGKESVFLRSKAPFTAVSANAAQASLRKALPGRCVPGSGFHALRKTFATNMLRAGAEPTQVAEALGHRGVDNVRKYLSLDGERMRLCAISLAEAGLTMEGGFPDGA